MRPSRIGAFHTPYHDRAEPEIPKRRNLARDLEGAERSGVFDMDAVLQHPSGRWTSGRLGDDTFRWTFLEDFLRTEAPPAVVERYSPVTADSTPASERPSGP